MSHGKKVVKDVRRPTRTQYSAKKNVRIKLDELVSKDIVADLCRHEGTRQSFFFLMVKELRGGW